MLQHISDALRKNVDKTHTPQLLHPQLEQSPSQEEQVAQEQGDILVVEEFDNVGFGGWCWLMCVCMCVWFGGR